jgi:hypothetical protein
MFPLYKIKKYFGANVNLKFYKKAKFNIKCDISITNIQKK